MNTNISEFGIEDGRLSTILLDSGDELDVDGLFVYVGFVPGTKFANELGITDENGYILVNKKYETNYITDNSSINLTFEGNFAIDFKEGYTHNFISNILLPPNHNIFG